MSNPTELPGLGKLEALRRLIECAEILNKRPRPMCRDCADEDGTCPSSGLQCDMDALIASVKSLYNSIVLARRAQPEGEAPQAVYQFRAMNMRDCWIECDAGSHDRLKAQESAHLFEFRTLYAAATLSPLCGAQHAESGKEVSDIAHSIADRVVRYELRTHSAIATVAEAVLRAAQQAAAPVDCSEQRAEPEAWQVLEMSDQPDSDRLLDVVLKNGVMREGLSYAVIDWTQVADWRYSAPGTPEAPKWHAPGMGEVHSQDHVLMIHCSREIDDPDIDYVADNELAKRVCDALNAAQLDGGQEGSESNG